MASEKVDSVTAFFVIVLLLSIMILVGSGVEWGKAAANKSFGCDLKRKQMLSEDNSSETNNVANREYEKCQSDSLRSLNINKYVVIVTAASTGVCIVAILILYFLFYRNKSNTFS